MSATLRSPTPHSRDHVPMNLKIAPTLTRHPPDVSLMGMEPLTKARRGRVPWRRCSSCLGICHWHDTAWVCDDCDDEWDEDHDPKFGPPTERNAR